MKGIESLVKWSVRLTRLHWLHAYRDMRAMIYRGDCNLITCNVRCDLLNMFAIILFPITFIAPWIS